MYTDVTFSMDAHSSAPHRVGSLLVPQVAQYFTRWIDRNSYVTLMVRTSIADDMIAKVCATHPSVRCIARDGVVPPSTTGTPG